MLAPGILRSDERSSPQLAIRQLDWTVSTTEVFGHFAHQSWAMLLDSADAPHEDAGYDIICAHPIATLVTRGDSSVFHLRGGADSADGQQVNSVDDPFTLLQHYLTALYPVSHHTDLPFSGGAMGSFSYDLGRRIERLSSMAAQDLSLPEMNIGFYDWALIFDRGQQRWQLVHYLGEPALQSVLNNIQQMMRQTVGQGDFRLTSPWENQLPKADYQAKFDKIQSYLHSGDCYQINLTQRFSASFEGDEWAAYLRLRAANKAPFSAFIRLDDAAILSISPERFIRLQGDEIQTKPIKGTLPREADKELDDRAAKTLQSSLKDRAENLMIVDLLRNDIGKVASPGSVRVPRLFDIESFPAVHHLVSTVTATLGVQYQATDLLRAAFPGGSITGAPKIRAMEIIEELEPSRRSIYCGSIGYLSQDRKMDTSITIRTLLAQAGQIHCWAGGGIVADSKVDAEYQESFDKVSRILPLLEQPAPIKDADK
jgi:para-aminobenzoate synthetase component I